MEWRIILPVLCLIGILHLPGYVVSQETTTTTTVTTPTTETTVATPTTTVTTPTTATTVATPTTTVTTQTTTVTTPTTATTVTTPTTAAGSSSSSTGGSSTAATTQTTIGPLPANLGVVNLAFKTNDTFQSIYTNLSDAVTIVFVNKLKSQLEPVYKNRYTNFYKLIVNSLSAGSVVADTTLQFDTTSSSAPNATDVKNTLIQAINSGGINLTIDNTSITAVQVSNNGSSTAASPGATTQTTTAATTAIVLANYNITFKMLGIFISDLANPNSNAASLLTLAVNSQLAGFFSNFRGFSATGVWRFRNGSIIVDAWLAFIRNINAPNGTELAKQFGAAVRNQTILLPIDPLSINVTDFTGFTANKSPVLASMLTALWMTLASLLFSAVMH